MHNPKQRGQWLLIVALMLTAISVPVQAQNSLESSTLIGGGREDHVLYYHPTTRPQDLSDARIILYAQSAALQIYQPLFGANSATPDVVPFQIVWNLTGRENTAAVATAQWQARTSPQVAALTSSRPPAAPLDEFVCYVEVFAGVASITGTPGASENGDLDMAHELAHCYQYYFITQSLGEVSKRWWVEGSANWLASLVYPEQAPPANASAFDRRRNVLLASYDNYYFWEFLASPQGLGSEQATVAFMKSIPESASQFPQALEGAKPGTTANRLLHDWAMAVLNSTLPFPAPVNPQTFYNVNASVPSATTLQHPPFSVDYTVFRGFVVEEGHQAYLTVSGIDAHNYVVSIMGSTFGTVELTDGQQYMFCPPSEGVTLIHSRGNGGSGSAPLHVEWGQTPSDTPCGPLSQVNVNARCLLGTWGTVRYPPSDLFSTMDLSQFTWIFHEDSTMDMAYIISATEGRMTINANVSFTGTYRVNGTQGDILDAAFSLEIIPGGRYTSNYQGTVTDQTTVFYNTVGSAQVWNPRNGILCDDATMAWDAADGSGRFVLERR